MNNILFIYEFPYAMNLFFHADKLPCCEYQSIYNAERSMLHIWHKLNAEIHLSKSIPCTLLEFA